MDFFFFFTSSHMALAWLSLDCTCVYPVWCCCCCCFLASLLAATTRKRKKKKTDYQFEIHFPLHLPRPGHKHTIMDKQKPTFFSRSFFSLLKWNWIFCYLFVYFLFKFYLRLFTFNWLLDCFVTRFSKGKLKLTIPMFVCYLQGLDRIYVSCRRLLWPVIYRPGD